MRKCKSKSELGTETGLTSQTEVDEITSSRPVWLCKTLDLL